MIPKGFSITMVEPLYPVNVGYVARLAKNFGVKKLYFVNPRFDISTAIIYSSHAADLLKDAQTKTFDEIRNENDLLIATTSVAAKRTSNAVRQCISPEQLSRYMPKGKATLVLGREGTGLRNEEIKMCDVSVTIETGTEYNVLNISHAAAIILYVIARDARLEIKREKKSVDVFLEYFKGLVENSRLPEHKRKSVLLMSRRLVFHSGLSDRDLMILTGIFRRVLDQLASKT